MVLMTRSVKIREVDYILLRELALKTNRTITGMISHIIGDWVVEEANTQKHSRRKQTTVKTK